ncbi:hypothetical protein GCM10020001_007350 [Nonomuraea salmonea]
MPPDVQGAAPERGLGVHVELEAGVATRDIRVEARVRERGRGGGGRHHRRAHGSSRQAGG